MYFNILAINSKHKYRNQTTIGSWNQSFPQKLESSDLNRFHKKEYWTYICVKLPDKTWKIVVLEILGKQIWSEFWGIPHNKTTTTFTPWHHGIRYWIIHQLICFYKKRRWGTRTTLWPIHTIASTAVQNLNPKSVYKYLLAHTKDNILIRLAIGSNLHQVKVKVALRKRWCLKKKNSRIQKYGTIS